MTDSVVPPLAINTGWREILRVHHIRILRERLHGPMGISLSVRSRIGVYGSIIVSQSDNPDTPGIEWLHASLAWDHVMPTYEDLVLLHRAFFGRKRYAYQVFAPESEHISGTNDRDGLPGHEYALHLWGRIDGTPALPEFGSFLGRV